MIAAPPRQTEHSRYAWRGALVACGLNAVGLPFDLLLGREVPNMPVWPSLASGAAGALLAIVLLVGRRRPTARLAMAVFMVNTAVILVALWITSGAYAAAPARWIPFQANKIGALAAAVLAPDLATGLISISGFVGMVLLRYMSLPVAQQQRMPIGEPWTILIYGVFAFAILATGCTASRSRGGCYACAPNRSPRSGWRGRSWPCATSPTRRCRRSSWPRRSCARDVRRWRRSWTASIAASIASIG